MKAPIDLSTIRHSFMNHRGHGLDPRVEEKIKQNIFTIAETLLKRQGGSLFQSVVEGMMEDWKRADANHIQFEQLEQANKTFLKLMTMQFILTHPLMNQEEL